MNWPLFWDDKVGLRLFITFEIFLGLLLRRPLKTTLDMTTFIFSAGGGGPHTLFTQLT